MNQVTDMKMAINTTFGSILNEIQLSNLNFSIQMTPYAAYIVLKKSAQRDPHGVPVSPSPPVLYLLQKAQQEHLALQDENYNLKVALEMLEKKNYTIVRENAGLREEIEEKNIVIETMKANDDMLHSRLELLEEEQSKSRASKAATELKIKEINKKHTEELRDLNVQVGKLSKALKVKEKVDKDLKHARETIKTLRSEKSLLKTVKTKLEGETRKLEKKLKVIENKKAEKVSHDKAADNTKRNHDEIVDNMVKCIVLPASVQAFSTSLPSIVSHWHPHVDTLPQNQRSIPSMISHCIFSPPPEEEKLLTKEVFLQLWAEHREQVKKDWKEILSKINIFSI